MSLKTKKILSFIENDFEDLEFWYPILRLQEEGFITHIVSKNSGEIFKGKYGVSATSNISFDEIDVKEYDGLLVPGGWAPDKLRRDKKVLDIVREMDKANKIIGHICHGGWVLISADILRNKKVTSTVAIFQDLINAGATWVDEEVVVDQNIVSSRKPMDLPAYMREFLKLLR